ncbi:MAG TPA: MBL fold metallo-hydrolase [Tepidisphaeraceae bacterium]|nr:MBL fold metallo-hydrolase [Tepidisphaeraceae bacterium]
MTTETLTALPRKLVSAIHARHNDDGTIPVTRDVASLTTLIANVVLVGQPGGTEPWVLVDAGMPYTADKIESAANRRFGRPPAAIVLTHGHFDHVGALRTLADRWNVPVYVHRLEVPYVTGRSSYPPPDPTVGGGMMARLSPLFPRGPYDVSRHVRELPGDGSVPHMPGWRWVFTPGHSPGHVALFRDADRTLIAGDAFVTTRQESAMAAATQYARVNRPPAYWTLDWSQARESVERLLALDPAAAITGHGLPMEGDKLKRGLERLVRDFEQEMPRKGRYVQKSVYADERGVIFVPPPVSDPFPKVLGAIALTAGAALIAAKLARRDD